MRPKSGKDINCVVCGKEFYIKKHQFNTTKYCSNKCRTDGLRNSFITNCKICNKEFSFIAARMDNAKYCSRSCYYQSLKDRGAIDVTCKCCDKTFRTIPSRRQIYCSTECMYIKSIKNFKPTYQTVRKKIFKKGMLKECVKCGYKEHPEILGMHHINGNPDDNRIENLIALCANCHSAEHLKHIVH